MYTYTHTYDSCQPQGGWTVFGAGHVGYPAVGVLAVARHNTRVSLVLRVSSVQWSHSSVDLMAGGVSLSTAVESHGEHEPPDGHVLQKSSCRLNLFHTHVMFRQHRNMFYWNLT